MKLLTSIFILICLTSNNTLAQGAEMADTFRADGKIYVVVAIIMIILIGLFAYLFSMDRKVANLEKRINKKD